VGSRHRGASLGIREWIKGLTGGDESVRMVVAALFINGREDPKYLLLMASRWGRCAPAAEGGWHASD
jgi:hypothetical protein